MFAAAIRPIFAPGAIALRWAVAPWPGFGVYVSIDGVERATDRLDESKRILLDSLVVTETRTLSTPNRCTFKTHGFGPSVGDRVLVRLGGSDNPDRLFAGNVVSVQQTYVGTPGNVNYAVTCNDDAFVLSFRKITGRFLSTSVSSIVSSLMDDYAADFTYNNLEAGLGTLDEFTFTNETLVDVLQRLAKRIGGTVYLDTQGDLHFFVTPEIYSQPVDLTEDHPTLGEGNPIEVDRDISQMVTRVHVEGGGPNALSEVAAGDTILPVQDPTWFNDAGGAVACGPQRIDYTDVDEGGGGGLVGTGFQPETAPMLGFANGSGVTTGLHDVTVVFETAAGTTLPSPVASFTVGDVPAPTTAPTAGTPTAGGSITAGAHYYAYTEDTPAGETEPSPISNTVTAVAEVADPTGALTLDSNGTFRANGKLDTTATYGYAYSFSDATGARETNLSPLATCTLTGSNNAGAILASSVPTPPAGFHVRFYRTEGDGATYKIILPGGQSYGQFAEFTGTHYIDICADSALGATAPVSNNTKQATVLVSGIPPASAFATDRNLYRTEAGGSTLKLVDSIGTTATSYSDTMADGDLGATAPASTPTANRIAVSGIQLGPSGTTARRLYMSAAGGGGTRRLALTIADNTTTTGTITISDATLAGEAAEPGTDTSGLSQPTGQVLAGATSLPVAGLAGFPSAGWAVIGNGQQVIRYTGKSSTALTGVPASGVGAIASTIAYNSSVTAAPQLTGIPSSGAGSIQFDILKGDPVNLWVTVDDVNAQAELAALVGGDGIREDVLQDRRINEDEARARGMAYLELRAEVAVKIRWRSRDRETRAGRLVTVNLPAPHSLAQDFEIQQVMIHNFQPALGPWFDATGSTELFSLEELFRMARKGNKAA